MLRVIRKYAEVLGVLLKIKDSNDILNGIDYLAFLHPYNVIKNPPDKLTLVDCTVYKDTKTCIVFNVNSPYYLYRIRCIESDMTKTLFELASIAYQQKLIIKFIDSEKLLAKHNVVNIFGKNLFDPEKCLDQGFSMLQTRQ